MKTIFALGLMTMLAVSTFATSLGLTAYTDIPTVSKFDQLAQMQSNRERKMFFVELSVEDRIEVWNTQLTNALGRSDLNLPQRELLNRIITKLPDIMNRTTDVLGYERQVIATFTDASMRQTIFKVAGTSSMCSPQDCTCSYDSGSNYCNNCQHMNYGDCSICEYRSWGCGFMMMMPCDGLCITGSMKKCW